MVSKWQADPAIAKRALDGEVDITLSGDSDFSVHIGFGGPDGFGDVMLRKPEVTQGQGLKSLQMWTGQNKTSDCVSSTLQSELPAGTNILKKPKFPLFDGLEYIRPQTLFALAVGCDVLPGGVRQFGPKQACSIKSGVDWNNAEKGIEELLARMVEIYEKAKKETHGNLQPRLSKEDFIIHQTV